MLLGILFFNFLTMHLTISAPSLTKPTYQTLEEYATRRFKKIEKFLRKKDKTEHELRISVDKSGDFFELSAEIFIPVSIIVKTKNRDLRKAIDDSLEQLKRKLKEGHERNVNKKINRRRVIKRIKSFAGNFF